MLHLRVIVPQELTDTVGELFVREPGVVQISVTAGAGIDPVGDVLEADVEHAALRAVGALAQRLINVAGLLVAGVGSLWIGRRLARRPGDRGVARPTDGSSSGEGRRAE